MLKKILLLVAIAITMTGCFMAPLAFIGPATSGFSTASIMQSGLTSGANYLVKKTTGKTVTEHAFESLSKDIMQQTFLPKDLNSSTVKKIKTKK